MQRTLGLAVAAAAAGASPRVDGGVRSIERAARAAIEVLVLDSVGPTSRHDFVATTCPWDGLD